MGCGIVESVTDAVGITNHEGQEDAQRLAESNAAFSQALTKEELAFQREQYEDWKGIYGDLQENLGNYYNSLSADDYIAKGVTAVNKEYAAANKSLTQQLAQRGISNSGIAAASLTSLEQQSASAKANIRATADQQVATDKMQFLGLGLGQGTQMLGINAQVAGTGINASSSLAGTALGVAQKYSQQNTDAMGTLVGGGISLATGGAFFPKF